MYNTDFVHSDDLKSDIIRLIKWRGDGLSFVELCRSLPQARGVKEMTVESNLVLWRDISDQAIETLNQLVDDEIVHYETCGKYTYFVEGGFLTLPIAKALRPYKTPHWLRVVIKMGKFKIAA
jgi:hypothetical protein